MSAQPRNPVPGARSEVFLFGVPHAILSFMQDGYESEQNLDQGSSPSPRTQNAAAKSPETSPELLALFRLLMREPPADHDFNTCAICKHYGITRI
jgi:hypothetical protein